MEVPHTSVDMSVHGNDSAPPHTKRARPEWDRHWEDNWEKEIKTCAAAAAAQADHKPPKAFKRTSECFTVLNYKEEPTIGLFVRHRYFKSLDQATAEESDRWHNKYDRAIYTVCTVNPKDIDFKLLAKANQDATQNFGGRVEVHLLDQPGKPKISKDVKQAIVEAVDASVQAVYDLTEAEIKITLTHNRLLGSVIDPVSVEKICLTPKRAYSKT